jgi:hypothetical protein
MMNFVPIWTTAYLFFRRWYFSVPMVFLSVTLRMLGIHTEIKWRNASSWSCRNWRLEELVTSTLLLIRFVYNSFNLLFYHLFIWSELEIYRSINLWLVFLLLFSYFFLYLTFCWMNCQSRVGPVQWLKPYTDEVLVELGQKGVKSLLAVPVRYTIISLLPRQCLLAWFTINIPF